VYANGTLVNPPKPKNATDATAATDATDAKAATDATDAKAAPAKKLKAKKSNGKR